MDGSGPNSCYTVSPSCAIRGNGKCTQTNNGIEKGFFTPEKRKEMNSFLFCFFAKKECYSPHIIVNLYSGHIPGIFYA